MDKGLVTNPEWSCIYEKAIRDDGSLFFPERLTREFLDSIRRTMGSYLFANQYQNEILPEGEETFKRHWLRYYNDIPTLTHTFAFIDPAISEEKTADYTALVVVQTDVNQNWYVKVARRERINPSELINLIFKVNKEFSPLIIGIEDVAFQRAIIHFSFEEMKNRGEWIPVHGVKIPTDKTKYMRIMSLVPRFEWGSMHLNRGLHDLELELAQFPRGAHDDLIDAMASLQQIVTYPANERKNNETPSPNHPDYERWFIERLAKGDRNPSSPQSGFDE